MGFNSQCRNALLRLQEVLRDLEKKEAQSCPPPPTHTRLPQIMKYVFSHLNFIIIISLRL